MLSKAFVVKRKYVNTSAQASAFLLQVESDDKMSWISPEMMSPVTEAQDKLKMKLSPFFLQLISGAAMQQLKKDNTNNNDNSNNNNNSNNITSTNNTNNNNNNNRNANNGNNDNINNNNDNTITTTITNNNTGNNNSVNKDFPEGALEGHFREVATVILALVTELGAEVDRLQRMQVARTL